MHPGNLKFFPESSHFYVNKKEINCLAILIFWLKYTVKFDIITVSHRKGDLRSYKESRSWDSLLFNTKREGRVTYEIREDVKQTE